MDHAVDALRARGESFAYALTTLAGHYVEVEGRAIGGQAVLRIKDLTGVKAEHAALAAEQREAQARHRHRGDAARRTPLPGLGARHHRYGSPG